MHKKRISLRDEKLMGYTKFKKMTLHKLDFQPKLTKVYEKISSGKLVIMDPKIIEIRKKQIQKYLSLLNSDITRQNVARFNRKIKELQRVLDVSQKQYESDLMAQIQRILKRLEDKTVRLDERKELMRKLNEIEELRCSLSSEIWNETLMKYSDEKIRLFENAKDFKECKKKDGDKGTKLLFMRNRFDRKRPSHL